MTKLVTEHSEGLVWDVVSDAEALKVGLLGRIAAVLPQLWASRQLAWRLFQRNFLANYRQSLLGWLWIFLPPMAAASVWVFLNASGTVRISPLGPIGYAAFVFCGMMMWQGFIDGLMGPTNTLLANRSALTKLQFPRETFVTLCLLETGFDFFVRAAVATLFLLIAGLIDWAGLILLVVVWGPLLLVLGVAFGLWLAPFGLLYKDVSRSIAMISPLWMLLTPVIYELPTGYAGHAIAWVNPPAAIIHVARDGAISTPAPVNQVKEAVAISVVQRDSSNVNMTAEQVPSADTPKDSIWVQVACWSALGVLLFVSGAVWLDLSGPIVIERLAN